MTFVEIQNRVAEDCGFGLNGVAVEARVVTRIKNWINEGSRNLLRDPQFSGLRDGTMPFSSVIDQKLYALPQAFESIVDIVQQSNDRRLTRMTLDVFRSIDPAERTTGTPTSYVPFGYRPVFRQPAATGSGVWAVSTALADTTQVVNFQAVRLNGDVDKPLQATVNGTTRVQIGTVTDYIDILSWNIATVGTGDISLYDAAAAGNELGRIPRGLKSVRFLTIRLWPTPSDVLPYIADGQFRISDLVQDSDVPMWCESFHDVLVDYAEAREFRRAKDWPAFKIADGLYREHKEQLRQFVEFPPDWYPVAGVVANRLGRNNLGSWYPADWSWP